MVKQPLRKGWIVGSIPTSGSKIAMAFNRNRLRSAKFRNEVHWADSEDDSVLYRKLVKSLFGIFAVFTITILTLQFFGPQIFNALSLLSIDRWKKVEKQKRQTAAPTFQDLPKASKEKTINLSGFTEPSSTVRLFANGPEIMQTTSDNDGKFSFLSIKLIEGQNILFAKSTAPNKEESEKSDTLYIAYDIQKPVVLISSPKDGERIENVDSRVTVKGNVNEDATINVNAHNAVVDNSGNFQALISLKDGDNKIMVIAKDVAGNEATASITVNFNKL